MDRERASVHACVSSALFGHMWMLGLTSQVDASTWQKEVHKTDQRRSNVTQWESLEPIW